MPEKKPYLTAKGQPRCHYRKSVKGACRSFALRNESYCFAHSRNRPEEVRAARSAGGTSSRRSKLSGRLTEVIKRLYGKDEEEEIAFAPIPAADVKQPPRLCVVDGTKFVKWFDPWTSETPLGLAIKALALVGIERRERAPHGVMGYYRGEKRVEDSLVNRFLSSLGIPLIPVKGPPQT